MHLHHHAFLACINVSDFGNSVSWSTNFEKDFPLNRACGRGDHQLSVFGITGGTTGKVGLVLFTLRMCKVRSFVCVQRQTETAFEGSKMVSENIWILGNGWLAAARKIENQYGHTLARSIVSRASFRRRSRLSTLDSDAPATPPPPNLEPTRFCRKCESEPWKRLTESANLEVWIFFRKSSRGTSRKSTYP